MIGSVGRARKIELLGHIPLFATCSKRQLGQVAALTVPAELKKGTVMTRQGAAGGLAFIIVTGRAEMLRDGKRRVLLGPGDVVGELSLIDGEPRSATVTRDQRPRGARAGPRRLVQADGQGTPGDAQAARGTRPARARHGPATHRPLAPTRRRRVPRASQRSRVRHGCEVLEGLLVRALAKRARG